MFRKSTKELKLIKTRIEKKRKSTLGLSILYSIQRTEDFIKIPLY